MTPPYIVPNGNPAFKLDVIDSYFKFFSQPRRIIGQAIIDSRQYADANRFLKETTIDTLVTNAGDRHEVTMKLERIIIEDVNQNGFFRGTFIGSLLTITKRA